MQLVLILVTIRRSLKALNRFFEKVATVCIRCYSSCCKRYQSVISSKINGDVTSKITAMLETISTVVILQYYFWMGADNF